MSTTTPTAAELLVYEDERGVARIRGTRSKVIQVVRDHLFRAWDAEEIARNYDHLTCEQVEAALAYYATHREAIDAQIQEADAYAERRRAETDSAPSRDELERRLAARRA